MSETAAPQYREQDGFYRISAVARLTGISIATIRMWELRYGVVTPARSDGNNRLYSQGDIERLRTLKAAVDAGHAIGTIAALSTPQIASRLGAVSPAAPVGAPLQAPRIAVVGHHLPSVLSNAWAGRTDITIVWTRADAGVPAGNELPQVDALIVEASTLAPAMVATLRGLRSAFGARAVVVVYAFAARQTLARLAQADITALSDPADPAQVARVCQLALSAGSGGPQKLVQELLRPVAAPRYTDAYLAALSQHPTAVQCECPNHLASLLSRLTSFERYSLDCESQNATDAAVHALLYSAAGHCREILELVLQKVIEHEGITPPDGVQAA